MQQIVGQLPTVCLASILSSCNAILKKFHPSLSPPCQQFSAPSPGSSIELGDNGISQNQTAAFAFRHLAYQRTLDRDQKHGLCILLVNERRRFIHEQNIAHRRIQQSANVLLQSLLMFWISRRQLFSSIHCRPTCRRHRSWHKKSPGKWATL